MMESCDVIVVGSGIAGLSFAIELAELKPELTILIISKVDSAICNTALAQGGLAAVVGIAEDSIESHLHDTMLAGGGKSDRNVVEIVVKEAKDRIRQLQEWGVAFDIQKDGSPDLHLEGGHSFPRILHKQDSTGKYIHTTLLGLIQSFPNIWIRSDYFAMDILSVSLKNDEKVYSGLKVFSELEHTIKYLSSKVCLLATGGCGLLYEKTSNSPISTGDGVAMARRAGVKIRDMRYIQFHPTALFEDNNCQHLFLISEAVRGYGAYIVDGNRQRFLFKYDSRGELATRDIVSSSIAEEMQKQKQLHMYLDFTHLSTDALRLSFPSICAHLESKGYNLNKNLIPILPAAHYQCGGIASNLNAETSLRQLYVSGECSSTGLHGSNRLASNSLPEAMVFSHRAAIHIAKHIKNIAIQNVTKIETRLFIENMETENKILGLQYTLRHEMNQCAALLPCSEFELRILKIVEKIDFECQKILERNYLSVRQLELINMLDIAKEIVHDKVKYDTNQSLYIH